MITRRTFIRNSMLAAGAALTVQSHGEQNARKSSSFSPVRIRKVGSAFEREPLIRPFGFKGGYMTEIWQSAGYLESESGLYSTGLCTQNVLWSDATVFASHTESCGNALMYAVTERALQMARGQHFTTPMELTGNLLPGVFAYAKNITGNPNLRKTFVLNALVGIDNAAWLLYARENGVTTFDEMIPTPYRPALSQRHNRVAAIPLMAYSIPVSEIESAVGQGFFFMKIKIGQPGTQQEMLEKDCNRLTEIHQALKGTRTPFSADGKLPYYFDANGRYEKKETLLRLLDHARKIDAFDQIAIIEEPFPEEVETDVADIPVRLAADESAHTDEDAVKRIDMGYKAIALKAIAKTLSITLKIAQAAYDRQIPCFCADLTVNPVLVEWNKNVAARLSPFPGLGSLGLLESNGHQNYQNWSAMMDYHPRKDAPWVKPKNGVYELGIEFFNTGGGIYDPLPHWDKYFGK